MYDPKFSQKQMYDQYGRSRETTKKADPKPSKSSGFGGMGPDPAERFGGSPTRGIGAKPPSTNTFGGGQDNNPNRDESENKSTVAKVYEKAVDLFKSFGADEPKDVIVDGKRVYQGPAFRGYDPTTRIGQFGGEYGKQQYLFDAPKLGIEVTRSPVPPTLPPSTINMFGVNTDNPRLNMFGVNRGSTRPPAAPELPTSPDVPANMDPLTRGLSQAMLPIPDEPTAPYTIKAGDTLSEIAEMTGTTVEELAEINNIEKVDEIDAGAVIDIPIRRKRAGLGAKPISTEFMDAETKAMIEEATDAGYSMEELRSMLSSFTDKLRGIKSDQPINVRNNNLGNIKNLSSNKWKGQNNLNTNETFANFDTPELGIRALKKVIIANIKATDTFEEYVNRYASEPNEKKYYKENGELMPHLKNYAKIIAKSQGIEDIKSSLPTMSEVDFVDWIKATARAEGGADALSYFTDDIIETGINLE